MSREHHAFANISGNLAAARGDSQEPTRGPMPVSVARLIFSCFGGRHTGSRLGRALLLATAAQLTACAPEYPDHYAHAERMTMRSPRPHVPRPSKAVMSLPAAPTCNQDPAGRKEAVNAGQQSDVREVKVAKLQTAAADVIVEPPADKRTAADSDNVRDPNSDMARLIKLEYERECYRQAEIRTRRQFARLQAAMRETLSALDQQKVAETTARAKDMR